VPETTCTKSWRNLLVAIGGSAGAVGPICRVIEQLPEDFQGAILIATHRGPTNGRDSFKEMLSTYAHMDVRETVSGEELECTTIFVSKSRAAMKFNGKELVVEDLKTHVDRMRQIDTLFESAAELAGDHAVGIILSGALFDGVAGLRKIADRGGYCIVQEPDEAQFKEMPARALENVEVNFVGCADEIADRLIEIASGETCDA